MKSKGWETVKTDVDVIHVHPLGDLIEHDLGDTGDCLCGPKAELTKNTPVGDVWMYVHASLDGREAHE